MTDKVFGVRTDGTIGICRAKPENRGKGRCDHGEHLELSQKQLKENFVNQWNEKILAKEKEASVSKKSYPSATAKSIQAHGGGTQISTKELEQGSNSVAAKFRQMDFDFIQNFYEKYERALTLKERAESENGDPATALAEQLRGDEPEIQKLREFLGPAVDLDDLSDILVSEVGGMTIKKRWTPVRHDSMARIVLSNLNNDMNKRRYVASVLFFGGRCCYCNRVLKRGTNGSGSASAEHLTPINPENPKEVVGGTRYGNMALACRGCNGERANKDLNQWLKETRRVNDKHKAAVLGRIKAFREFALYEEYSEKDSMTIKRGIAHLNEKSQQLRGSKGFTPSSEEAMRQEFAKVMYILSNPEN